MQKRKSNFELLRIISMLLIISFHYVFKSEFVFEQLNYNSFVVKMFYFFGELGVNLFILISGYFLVNGKFSIKKLIKLILEINFYYIFCLILQNILNYNVRPLTSTLDYFKLFFSVIFENYWFATVYILIYIFSPYINTFIHNVKKEVLRNFILTAILLWSIIPTFFGIFYNNPEKLLYYNRFIWLIVIYIIGAYIRLYGISFFEKKGRKALTALTSFATLILSIFIIYNLKNVSDLFKEVDVAYLWRPNTIPILILSISIFEIFKNLKIGHSKIINLFASTTLGIYMLHDGPLIDYIWKVIFKTKEHLQSNKSVIYILSAALIIFLVGAIIDLIRQFIEKQTVNRVLESKFFDKIQNKCIKKWKNGTNQ